jgi:hypothetical protein
MSNGWIGVDLDGTLAKYDGWVDATHIGDPVPLMVSRVQQWLAEGKDVRIFTARISERYEYKRHMVQVAIEKWCEKNIGATLPITCTKDYAMRELWDDRAVQVEPNTGRRIGCPICSGDSGETPS